MKLILTAEQLAKSTLNQPEVTKPTGGKKYVFHTKLPVFGGDVKVEAEEGVYFLASKSGVNIISGDTELAIHVKDVEELELFASWLRGAWKGK